MVCSVEYYLYLTSTGVIRHIQENSPKLLDIFHLEIVQCKDEEYQDRKLEYFLVAVGLTYSMVSLDLLGS